MPAQIPEQADLRGTSVQAADISCLNASITANELHSLHQAFEAQKLPGVDGVLSELLKDGGNLVF